MTYSIIERRSGNQVASFPSMKPALDYVLESMDHDDEWALVEFGAAPTDNRLVASEAALIALASLLEDDGSTHDELVP